MNMNIEKNAFFVLFLFSIFFHQDPGVFFF